MCSGLKSMHFIFALDDSGSMKSVDNGLTSRWQQLITAFKGFIDLRIKNDVSNNSKDIVSVIFHSSTSVKVVVYEPISNVVQKIESAKPCFGSTDFS